MVEPLGIEEYVSHHIIPWRIIDTPSIYICLDLGIETSLQVIQTSQFLAFVSTPITDNLKRVDVAASYTYIIAFSVLLQNTGF